MLLIPQLATKRPRTTTMMGASTGRRQRDLAGASGSDMVCLRWAGGPAGERARSLWRSGIGLGLGVQGRLSPKRARKGRPPVTRSRFHRADHGPGTALSDDGAKRFSVV